jgi:hypothetical protein
MTSRFDVRSLPILVKVFIAWALLSVFARALAGGDLLRVLGASSAGVLFVIMIFRVLTRAHSAVGRRLDAGEITNDQYVPQNVHNDLRWAAPALVVATICGALESPVWWATLAAPVGVFTSFLLFARFAERSRRPRT